MMFKLTSKMLRRSNPTMKPLAFAALKRDGSVVTWGNPTYGGDSRRVQRKLRGDFRAIKKSGFYGENQRGGIGNDGPRLC